MKFINLTLKCCLLAFAISSFSYDASALLFKDGKFILEKLDDYDLCHTRDRSGRYCHEALKEWVEKNPADMLKAAKMTRRRMTHWSALEFFYKAFKSNKPDCSDKDLHLAVISGLGLPASYGDPLKQAKEIAFTMCPDQMTEKIAQKASIGSYLFDNSCAQLIEKGKLKGLKAKKCKAQNKSK